MPTKKVKDSKAQRIREAENYLTIKYEIFQLLYGIERMG
jgi:hypothetical protein